MSDTTQDTDSQREIKRPVIRLLGKASGRGAFSRQRRCRFCGDDAEVLDYKNATMLRNYVTERGKLLPRRISGSCAKHQRALALAVRRARMIALVPFCVTGK